MLIDPLAIFHFHQSVVSGGAGHSAVAAAAYRHSAKMERDNTQEVLDYARKGDVYHSELSIPADAPEWVREGLRITHSVGAASDRLTGSEAIRASETLWNAVETGEKSANAKYAINVVLALPRELSPAQNLALVRAFVEENYTSKGRIADWAFHLPPGKEYNPHVHIASTVRPLNKDGFGAKNIRIFNENGEPVKSRGGHAVYEKFAGSRHELEASRASWAAEVNHHLALAGYDITVDHRSHEARGIVDNPTYHRGKNEYASNLDASDELARRDTDERQSVFDAFVADPTKVLDRMAKEQSTFSIDDITKLLNRYAPRRADVDALLSYIGSLESLVLIRAEIHDPESGKIVQKARYTTDAILEREAVMAETARARALDTSHGVDPERKIEARSRAETAQRFAYTPEQNAAIDRLTGEAGLGIMVGIAGAGKSTVMRAVNEIYEDDGRSVYGAALAGRASANLQDSSGIKSRTLASWELSWSKGFSQLERGDLFVIDEAGMVASEQMGRVLQQLDAFGAKVVLIGDAKQLQPIEAGAAFRSIAQEIGYVELTEVRRQERDDHAYASVLFGAGETKAAIGIYEGNDAFWFHDKRRDAWEATVDGWRDDWKAGIDVVMLAHANRDILALNTLAREAIKQEGGLSHEERFMTAYGARQFGEGDRVIFLKNEPELRVLNGTIGTVESVNKDRMTIQLPDRSEPVVIERGGYNNLDHGYAQTIHKSQGTTYDRVHVLATAGMDAQLTYVALSRHREEVTVHVPHDAFRDPRSREPLSRDQILERLGTDRLKDTTVDYIHSHDYIVAKAELEARSLRERTMAGRFDAFLDQRGLPHPAEVLRAVKDYAAQFLRQDRRQAMKNGIIVGEGFSSDRPIAVPDLSPPSELRAALNRLAHMQAHSAAMNHEGHARRAALFSAENELTHTSTAAAMRGFAEKASSVVAPSLAVAIGPRLADGASEPRLAQLSPAARQTLQANWTDVHAVLRATWELGNLEFARAVDTSYRQERDEAKTLADYERMVASIADPASSPNSLFARPTDDPVSEAIRSDSPFVPAITHWPETVDAVVAWQIENHIDVNAAARDARRHATTIWKEPDKALASVQAAIASTPGASVSVLDEIRKNPQFHGELQGGHTLLRRPDATRQQAIDAVPLFVNVIEEAHSTKRRLAGPLHMDEKRWREAMARPIPRLSKDALKVVSELNRASEMKRPDREPAQLVALSALTHRAAWNEVKNWREDVKARLEMPGAIDRIPGLAKEQRAEIKQTVARVEVAMREAENTRAIEISRERSRQSNLERSRGGYEY